ncbi:bifunctional helix-turn-helix transcriptional regulator/GNAT family N-acetyltransferase [Phenylobacterium sp.]|uniref:bifunctional helix-turn-helix transcriptional regulator/GNAT family N-acetyltransferase n=1 Tax=Phenylobacterium sp. TaxID=1871053 RepID=UPI0025EB9EFE|nr:bifunctional helix-turn-helix transcriptional regulator/GNAT family N-acetyltransferase [Phenylobacterium sp.]
MSAAPDLETPDPIAAVRRFNRFYTQTIGVLDKGYLGTDYTVAEGRVLYEIARADGTTAKAVGEIVGLDAGYLSRIVARLERDGVVARERSASDGRSAVLRLTPQGAEVFGPFDRRAAAVVEGLLAPLSAAERPRLVDAMRTVESLLGAREAAETPITLRPHRQGDMGWVIARNAEVYGTEYGWGPSIEWKTARICADFLERFDPTCERCWIAERDGERLGCVFLVRDEQPQVARLRLLLLTPQARGAGLGRRLAEACVAFAREAGYREVVLWTHPVLTAARKIYAAAGFVLEETWTHDDFGHPEVSETWRLRL